MTITLIYPCELSDHFNKMLQLSKQRTSGRQFKVSFLHLDSYKHILANFHKNVPRNGSIPSSTCQSSPRRSRQQRTSDRKASRCALGPFPRERNKKGQRREMILIYPWFSRAGAWKNVRERWSGHELRTNPLRVSRNEGLSEQPRGSGMKRRGREKKARYNPIGTRFHWNAEEFARKTASGLNSRGSFGFSQLFRHGW